MSERVRENATERVQTPALKDGSLAALTGLATVLLSVQRTSDGQWLDFADSTFKAAGWTTRQQAMTEVSASLAPGEYRHDLDLSAVTNPAEDDTLMVRVDESSGAAKNVPLHGELKVGQWVSELGGVRKI